MNSSINSPIIALHGFLGLPSDWDCLNVKDIQAFDVNSMDWTHLWDWATKFNNKFQNSVPKPVLMGYSLGGRLALHALIQNPMIWGSGIIISTHPGLSSMEDRQKRIHSDQAWAERFIQEDWDRLMHAWNSQSIFNGSHSKVIRKEVDYDRHQLASTLTKGSLGLQEDLRKEIEKLPIPLLWVVGENDLNYLSLASSIQFSHTKSQVVVVPGVGHRIPWDDPKSLREIISFNLF